MSRLIARRMRSPTMLEDAQKRAQSRPTESVGAGGCVVRVGWKKTSRMRFRIFTEPQEGATYDDQLAVALLAEELGFDAYFRSDHYIGFFNPPGLPGPTHASLPP